MGGGGSGGTFNSRSPQELASLVRKAEDETSVAAFEADLATMLADLLGTYNGRDVELVRERLEAAKEALAGVLEGTCDQMFGGSVAKHTYVDGLSDVDSIVCISEADMAGKAPAEVLEKMSAILRDKLPGVAVTHGRMAVTLDFQDGMSIQLLPAVRQDAGQFKIPSSRTEGWSNVDMQGFRDALTRRNQECSGKLVPTIKLAKAINGTLPESQQLSGYHIESLAIAAFRNYEGPQTTASMLPAFFEKAKDLVLSPIRDSTGQSVHVDAYLGGSDSDSRQAASHILNRIAKRMRNATAANSTAQWQAIFGLEE